MAQTILDIVAENIQKPHISQDMHKASMKKHEGEECKSLLAECEVGRYLRNRISCRDKAVNVGKPVKILSLGNLNQKTDNIDDD